MRVVLSDKHALISEDRVKNLTFAQLMFHYAEIKSRKEEENEQEIEKTKLFIKTITSSVDGIIKTIYNAAYNAAIYSRTDLKYDGVKQCIQDFMHKLTHKKEENEKTMEEEYKEISKVAPSELTVDISDWADSNLHIRKVKRSKRGENGGRRKKQ